MTKTVAFVLGLAVLLGMQPANAQGYDDPLTSGINEGAIEWGQ